MADKHPDPLIYARASFRFSWWEALKLLLGAQVEVQITWDKDIAGARYLWRATTFWPRRR